jgi:hypothetical protein
MLDRQSHHYADVTGNEGWIFSPLRIESPGSVVPFVIINAGFAPAWEHIDLQIPLHSVVIL